MKQPRRLTITNAQSISDWQIIMLKRQKSYAVSALGELKGKVIINFFTKQISLIVIIDLIYKMKINYFIFKSLNSYLIGRKRCFNYGKI